MPPEPSEPQRPDAVTAALIVIGNEILSGRTTDANLPFTAAKLNRVGIRLLEARVVRDDQEAIVEAVNACRAKYDYVFTTGGIGPTHDDITAEAVARAFGLPLVRNPEAVALLKRRYPPADLNEARLSMAEMPQGAVLVENPVSGAPGFAIGNVFVLAGVPSIMQAMLDGIAGGLKGGVRLRSRTVSCHLTEGVVAEGLSTLQRRFPEVEIGSYPFFRAGKFGASLVLRAADEETLARAAQELRALIVALGGEPFEDAPA